MKFLRNIQLPYIIAACLTLGLAPFRPPHVWEKLHMLVDGTLRNPMDIIDLCLHAAPWVLLLLKIVDTLTNNRQTK